MPERDLEAEVMKGNRREAGPFDLVADPDNLPALQAYLTDWLTANKWAPGHWGRFSLRVRDPGAWRHIREVRP